MYECIHIGICMRMSMYENEYKDIYSDFVYNLYYRVGRQSANFVKVFVIEKSTVKLKIRNVRKLICIWGVIEGVKELWVKGLKLWLMWIITDQSDW